MNAPFAPQQIRHPRAPGARIMNPHVLVWDLETVPDLNAVARVHGLDPADEIAVRAALGSKFPKHMFHRIACIGALIAERQGEMWQLRSLGAPHLGERTEAELISGFVDRIAQLRPQLVTFNGASFDLPVLRYRAMINRVSAPGLSCRSYFHRYSDDALDLCDALSCFDGRAKASLHELCRALGLPGKPDDIDGSRVDEYVSGGRIAEVAAYCESDIVNTYRVWLRHELFRGAVSFIAYEASEADLVRCLHDRTAAKPHLAALIACENRA